MAPHNDDHAVINAYDVLGVDTHSSPEAIRNAFRALSLIHHPDKVRGSTEVMEEAHNTFVQIRAAYETLLDPVRRAALDAQLLQAYPGDMPPTRSGSRRQGRPPAARGGSVPPSSRRGSSRSRTRGNDSSNGVAACSRCGWDHGTAQERREWINKTLRPERLWEVSYNLTGMEQRLENVRSWYRNNYPLESKTIDTLTLLVDHVSRLEYGVMRTLWMDVEELPRSCGPPSKRDGLAERVARVRETWQRWRAAEKTVAKYWDVMVGDTDPDEMRILHVSFLGLLERWKWDL